MPHLPLSAGTPPPLAPAHRARRGRPPFVSGAVHSVGVPTCGPVMALLRPQPLSDPQRDAERVAPPAGCRLRGLEVHGVRRSAGRGTDLNQSCLVAWCLKTLCLTSCCLTYDLFRACWDSGCRVLKVRGFLWMWPHCLWSSTFFLLSHT